MVWVYVFEMRWHGELWACVYKWVEVKMVNGNGKRFLCEREEKSWNIEPNETNSSFETLLNKMLKVQIVYKTPMNV